MFSFDGYMIGGIYLGRAPNSKPSLSRLVLNDFVHYRPYFLFPRGTSNNKHEFIYLCIPVNSFCILGQDYIAYHHMNIVTTIKTPTS
jgi:hypothetical protein